MVAAAPLSPPPPGLAAGHGAAGPLPRWGSRPGYIPRGAAARGAEGSLLAGFGRRAALRGRARVRVRVPGSTRPPRPAPPGAERSGAGARRGGGAARPAPRCGSGMGMGMGRGLRAAPPLPAEGGPAGEGDSRAAPAAGNPPSRPAGISGNTRREMSGSGVLMGGGRAELGERLSSESGDDLGETSTPPAAEAFSSPWVPHMKRGLFPT